MFFGKSMYRDPKKGLPRNLKRQLMFQVVFLVLVTGLLLRLVSLFDDSDADPTPRVAVPREKVAREDEPATDVSREIDTGGEIDTNVEIQGPVDPQPFVERVEVLSEAAVREARGELDVEAVIYHFQRIRSGAEAFSNAKPVLSSLRGDPVWTELSSRPNVYRGKLVEVRGNLVSHLKGFSPLQLDTEELLVSPNPAGVPSSYRAYIFDGDKFFVVNTWRKQREYSDMDPVVFRGYFSQIYAYDIELEGKQRRAKIPLLVGQDFQLLSSPLRGAPSLVPLYWLALALPLVAFAVIFSVSWSDRRSYARRRALVSRRSNAGSKTPKDDSEEPEESGKSGPIL